jgi:hypothetical protein
MLTEIKNIELNTLVEVSINGSSFRNYDPAYTAIEALIIGRFYESERCIVHNFDRCNRLTQSKLYEWISDPAYTMMLPCNILQEYKHYNWLLPYFIVNVKDNIVVSPDQFCIGCNLPSPHIKPNLPDNKFQCISCKVLGELQ